MLIGVYFALENVVLHSARGCLVHMFLLLAERLPDQVLAPDRGVIVICNLTGGALALLLDGRIDFVFLTLDFLYAGIVFIKCRG